MAHMLSRIDCQQGTKMAWHGLTDVKSVITLDDCWLSEWDIVPTELELNGKKTGWFLSTASNNPSVVIGRPYQMVQASLDIHGEKVVTGSYTPITNKRFLEIIGEALAGTPHKIASVGSVCRLGRIFVSVALDALTMHKIGHRTFESFLNFGSSHDLSSVLFANTSNECSVCNNTFTANLHHNGKLVNARIKHSKNANDRLDNLPQIIGAAIGVQAEFTAAFAELDKVTCDDVRARNIFTGFVTRNDNVEMGKFELSTRKKNIVNRLTELFSDSRRGNRGETLADVFSAGTDYYSHESSGGENRWKQFESSEFGAGAKNKVELWNVIRDFEKLEETEKRGELISN